MSDVSFEKKLEIAAKAFFRDMQGDPDYPCKTWQEQRDEFKAGAASAAFIETVYQWNKNDAELNTELTGDA